MYTLFEDLSSSYSITSSIKKFMPPVLYVGFFIIYDLLSFKSNTCIIITLLVLLKSRLMPRGYKPRLHSHYTFKTIPVLLMRRKCTNKLSESQHFFLFPKFTININKHSSTPHQHPKQYTENQ